MTREKYSSLLNAAKQALRDGNLKKCREITKYITERYPHEIEGWLILGGISSPIISLSYIKNAEKISPNDHRVKSALKWAEKRVYDTPSPQEKHDFSGKHIIQVDNASITQKIKTGHKSIKTQRKFSVKIFQQSGVLRGLFYLFKKGLAIALTIFLGVFITIFIMNRPTSLGLTTAPAQLDEAVKQQIQRTIDKTIRDNPDIMDLPKEERVVFIEDLRTELTEESSLNLPKSQRQIMWTVNALKFNWGRISIGNRTYSPLSGYEFESFGLNQQMLLQYLPNTLLVTGSAFLIVFVIGLPLALTLARNHGKWYDRLVSFFAPLSSIPSWVIGIILIVIFTYELNVLPSSGMYDSMPAENTWERMLMVFRHMILPVLSVTLSIFFQLVYSWRAYFMTFSSEDYVELGRAIGLSNRKLQRNYILKPSISYVITSFSLLFVSFWQMTMALEVVFDWHGLGWLYITKGLPNFWGESAYPGDLLISITLVVIFAYLMGTIVFLLDLIYVIVDPRIRFGKNNVKLRLKRRKRNWIKRVKTLFSKKDTLTSWRHVKKETFSNHLKYNKENQKTRFSKPKLWKRIKSGFREISRYPTAVIGLCLILILILGSIYAMLFLPYEEIGDQWQHSHFKGKTRVPKMAKPGWINAFQEKDYLSRIILDSTKGDAERQVLNLTEKTTQIILAFNFEYDYADFPEEVLLYLSSQFDLKRSFASVYWITPDGRKIVLENTGIGSEENYPMNENIPVQTLLNENPEWRSWYNTANSSIKYSHQLLFAKPGSEQPEVLPGQYQLVVDGLTFEPEGDIDGELVLLGQVFGAAGTDLYRRDLLVPLLWGMPFALIIGVLGAVSTTLISMFFAATGVWFGGWVDNLVQRLIDINLVLPVLAISVMAYAFLGIDIWTILIIYVFLNAFGIPTKNFRAAFLQIKEAPYIEAARSYGASNLRIILRYMVPRLIPVLIPQLVILIPSFVFLEATLGFFNIKMSYPTWGTVIYQATMRPGMFYSRYWMLQPITLLLLTGLGFSLFGFALERMLNPKLKSQ